MLRLPHIVRRPLSNHLRTFASSSPASGPGEGGNSPQNKSNNVKGENPMSRTFNILKSDLNKVKNFFKPNNHSSSSSEELSEEEKLKRFEGGSYYDGTDIFPSHCDVVVIGGGGVGSSVAYWLKQRARDGLNVVVVERDSRYERASTVLSVGGLRQQFSLPENIQMSLYGADFMRDVKEHLGDVELNFTPHGYLVLASEEGAETLMRNSRLQNELGARNELLNANQLKAKFPWICTDGIVLGCHGLEREGWFDPWALLMGYKKRAQEYGAHFVNGEVEGFEFKKQTDIIVRGNTAGDYESLDKVLVKMPNGETRSIKFAICVLAAGAYSGEVARMARIGLGNGMLSVPLPVEPRKRYVYVINTQGTNAPGLATPLTIDPCGAYFRRDGLGGNYLCGRSPSADQEPSVDNLDVDHDYFDTDVWPRLAMRCKAFESAKVVNAWAGFYEYNVFDENGIIGAHPYYNNMLIATGFSGHGIQQTPAVGRAISELIIDGQFRTIDLTRLGFDRIVVDRPMFESNIV
ncbi:FAD-dependent oxidoreductase domain-containing protein 1 [Stomoxys calcitrans]|uniref:FAD-dependent oxidoreductase domain-containing protein 1 n=1 Tax=Stomoxys calcitrans TaxID=35570 RepID=UPI0027E2E600|nr:FAD-dependent oxidoreductase domain-containing protein 1 [Stomoxys calcitrans]